MKTRRERIGRAIELLGAYIQREQTPALFLPSIVVVAELRAEEVAAFEAIAFHIIARIYECEKESSG